MLQSVSPLTLELIGFILKQQISAKRDRQDVTLNWVFLLFLFFSPSFPDSLLQHSSFFLTDPDLLAVSEHSGGFNCHLKIAVPRESNIWRRPFFFLFFSSPQNVGLKTCHSCTNGWLVVRTMAMVFLLDCREFICPKCLAMWKSFLGKAGGGGLNLAALTLDSYVVDCWMRSKALVFMDQWLNDYNIRFWLFGWLILKRPANFQFQNHLTYSFYSSS